LDQTSHPVTATPATWVNVSSRPPDLDVPGTLDWTPQEPEMCREVQEKLQE
jgi:hypothetical protein